MIKVSSIPIIFSENPIGRAYINVLKELDLQKTEIIFLGQGYKYNLIHKLFYRSNISPANRYLKNKDILYLTHQFEDFFSFRRNFISDMYKFSNILDFKVRAVCPSSSLNSEHSIKFIQEHSSKFFLNTGKEILKNVLNVGKLFYHLHPGYLPKIRGADSSLHSIDKLNKVGCTFFEMSPKIDKGKIYNRIELPFTGFKLVNPSSFKSKDLYRIWYYFFDNSLRAHLYMKILNEELSISLKNEVPINASEKGNYYSFMDINLVEKTFKNIFSEDEFN